MHGSPGSYQCILGCSSSFSTLSPVVPSPQNQFSTPDSFSGSAAVVGAGRGGGGQVRGGTFGNGKKKHQRNKNHTKKLS